MAGKLRALGVDRRGFHHGGRGERGGGVRWRGWREQRDDSARRLIVGMNAGPERVEDRISLFEIDGTSLG